MRTFRSISFAIILGLTANDAGEAQVAGLPQVSEFGRRYDGFYLLLSDRGINAGSLTEFNQAPPSEWKDWIVIVLGDPTVLGDRPGRWLQFVDAGGTLVVASESSYRGLERDFGLFIEGGPVISPVANLQVFSNPFCPLVRDFRGEIRLFQGVREVALNCAGVIGGVNAEELGLAWLPRGVLHQGAAARSRLPIIAGGAAGDGRFFVLSDQSILINEMFFVADNSVFADNLISSLIGDRDPQEIRVLVLENGGVVENLVDPKFEAGTIGKFSPGDLMRIVDELFEGLRKENFFNRSIAGAQELFNPRAVWMWVVLIASLLFLMALAGWLLRARASPPSPIAPPAKESAPVPAALARQQAVVALGNYLDPAHRILRIFFAEPLAWGQRDNPPGFKSKFGWWQTRKTRKKLARWWNMATGRASPVIKRRQFAELLRELADLESERKAGAFAFVNPHEPNENNQQNRKR